MRSFFASRISVIPSLFVVATLGALGAACSAPAAQGTESGAAGNGAGAPPPGVDDIDNSGQIPYAPPPPTGGAECDVLLCSDLQWWNAHQTNCQAGQLPPACSYKSALGSWWDTDLHVPSSTPIVLRHASRLDSQAVYKWGWMPQFTDMVTGEQFRFLHLRPQSRYTTSVGTTYDAGTVAGLSGGDTYDTGYPKYSTAAHLCVQTPNPFAEAFPGGMDACEASCPTSPPSCAPQSSQACLGGDLYWFDACGNQGGLVQSCGGCGCNGSACASCGSSCPSGPGLYCAGDGVTLQDCAGGAYSFAAYCLAGCHVNPPGQPDACNPGSCPSGNGAYCGSDIGAGLDPNTLYTCTGGRVTVSQVCPSGCQVAPPGQPDHCL